MLAAVIAGCGCGRETGDDEPSDYAATPRKALEAWVTAVREGDIETICRLLPRRRKGCIKSDRTFLETKLLPHVREQMRGLKGDLHYGAVHIADRMVIGMVAGESPNAYAIPVSRGRTQWNVHEPPFFVVSWPRLVLERPNPAAALPRGPMNISFVGWTMASGSVYPQAALWIDSRHVEGRLEIGEDPGFDLSRVRWIGARRLLPGRHVMVAAVKGDGGIAGTSAWLLTVR